MTTIAIERAVPPMHASPSLSVGVAWRVSAGAAGEHDRRLGRPHSADPTLHQGLHSANNAHHRGADSQDALLGHKAQHWRHRWVWVRVCVLAHVPSTLCLRADTNRQLGVVSSNLQPARNGADCCSCCTHSKQVWSVSDCAVLWLAALCCACRHHCRA